VCEFIAASSSSRRRSTQPLLYKYCPCCVSIIAGKSRIYIPFNPYLKCRPAAATAADPAALCATAECELSAATATDSPLAVLSYLLCSVSKFAAMKPEHQRSFQLRSLRCSKVEINFIEVQI
jgi:hypothetical protein